MGFRAGHRTLDPTAITRHAHPLVGNRRTALPRNPTIEYATLATLAVAVTVTPPSVADFSYGPHARESPWFLTQRHTGRPTAPLPDSSVVEPISTPFNWKVSIRAAAACPGVSVFKPGGGVVNHRGAETEVTHGSAPTIGSCLARRIHTHIPSTITSSVTGRRSRLRIRQLNQKHDPNPTFEQLDNRRVQAAPQQSCPGLERTYARRKRHNRRREGKPHTGGRRHSQRRRNHGVAETSAPRARNPPLQNRPNYPSANRVIGPNRTGWKPFSTNCSTIRSGSERLKTNGVTVFLVHTQT